MSKMLEANFKKITEKILEELLKFDELDKRQLNHMMEMLDRVEFFSGDDNPEIHDFFVKLIPTIQENLLFLRIQLYMPKTTESRLFISALYHEIMHILSVGRLQAVSGTEFTYKCGLRASKVFLENGYLSDKIIIKLENLNEALTDICAEYFYSIFEEDKYCAKHFINPIMRMCKNTSIEDYKGMIVPFMLNDEEATQKELMLIYGCSSLQEFEKALKECYLL